MFLLIEERIAMITSGTRFDRTAGTKGASAEESSARSGADVWAYAEYAYDCRLCGELSRKKRSYNRYYP